MGWKRIVCFVVMAMAISTAVYAQSITGSCATGIFWEFDTETGILNITGEGALPNYTSNSMPWYSQKSAIKEVTVSDGIQSIGNRAFYGCAKLERVELPQNLTQIGSYVFSGCRALNNIKLPENLDKIGSRAFYNCSALTEITLPDSLSALDTSTFSGCTSLSEVGLGSGLLLISDEAFFGCSSLSKIEIPESVIDFGEEIFTDCAEELNINVIYGSSAVEYFETQSYNHTVYCNVAFYSDNKQVEIGKYPLGGTFGFPSMPSREGYILEGWSNGTSLLNQSVTPIASANASYTAHWKMETIDVIYDTNGGEGGFSKQEKEYWSDLNLSSTIPEREGYDFIGWSENSITDEAEYLPGAVYKENRNLVLYAVWRVKTFTIIFDANGGTADIPKAEKIYTQKLQLTDIQPVKEGSTFLGWSKNPEAVLKEFAPGELFDINEDTTLYAVWSNGIISGDADNDGTVTVSDLLIVLKRINNNNITISEDSINAMDVYKDTYFNIKDVLKMSQYLAGWDNVVLGE